MAVGRILKTQISLSEQVNDLSLHAALLFTWMIPHADDFGRMVGNARKVKALVVPMRDDFTSVTVDDCLKEICASKLIERYEVNGEFFMQFPEWEIHQSGLHKRTKSKLPGPSFNEVPGSSGKFPAELELELEQEQEQEITTLLSESGANEKIDEQSESMKWVGFFINEKGFQFHEAQTSKTVPMFIDWVKRGVTEGDVEEAILACNGWLSRSGSKNAASPSTYKKFVDEVMERKQKSQGDPTRSNPGFDKNLRGNYDTESNEKGNNARSRANSGRKLSLVEQADESIRRVDERDRLEQQERERSIN